MLAKVWLPIHADRQALASQAVRAAQYVQQCQAAQGATSVCDAAIQALLADLAGSGPILASSRSLVIIVVSIASQLTPVGADALPRVLTVRPELYVSLLDDALLYSRDLNRLRPLLRHLFLEEKMAPLWTDLHSRLVHWARARPDLARETLWFLCDVHNTLRVAAFGSLHAGFLVAFHQESLLELVDAVFDLEDDDDGLETQLVGLVLDKLCTDQVVFPACRVLLHLFTLDPALARDVRVLVVLSWALRYHAALLQSDRDCRYLLETIFACLQAFADNPPRATIDGEYHIALATLLPPILELLSSRPESPTLLARASKLFDLVQSQFLNSVVVDIERRQRPTPNLINVWELESLSAILHVFETMASSWADLDCFLDSCAQQPCLSAYNIRAARFVLDTSLAYGGRAAVRAASRWMRTLLSTDRLALDLLPLFSTILYRVRQDRDAFVRIELLYALPHLALSPIGLTRVLRVVLPLGQHRSLRPLSLRLLAKLWLVERRSFSRLQQALLETRSTTNPMPVRRAVAAGLVDLCRHSATEALLLVPLLQTLLYDSDTITIALSIDALRELCHQGEMDLPAAHQLLEERGLRQYCVGSNPIAFLRLCHLLECQGADDQHPRFATMLAWLWTQTSPASSLSPDLRAAAYRSLTLLAERSAHDVELAPNHIVRFFSESEVVRELVMRLGDEKSGHVRPFLERFAGVVCVLQHHFRGATTTAPKTKDPAAIDVEAFAVSFPGIVKKASTSVSKQWRSVDRPLVRDVLAVGVLIGVPSQRDVSLAELVGAVLAPNLLTDIQVVIGLALPFAWSRYMDRLASDLVRQLRHDSNLVGAAVYQTVLDRIVDDLQRLDLGDSRVLGNVLMAKAGLAAKASTWGQTDLATRLQGEIVQEAAAAQPLASTTRPAALLALGVTVGALHPTDTDRRSAAFDLLSQIVLSSSNEGIVAAACLSIAIAATTFVRSEDDALETAALFVESFELLYVYGTKGGRSPGIAAAVGIAIGSIWPIVVRALPRDRLVAVHDELLKNSRFGLSCNVALYCLGGLSFRLFAIGAISSEKVAEAVTVYIDEVKKPSPLPGALIASASLLLILRYASNYVGLPESAPKQLGGRLVELVTKPNVSAEVASAAMIGFLPLLGIDVLAPFQGSRLPTDLCADLDFTAQITETFACALTTFSLSAHCPLQMALASALGLVSLGSAASWTTRASDYPQRVLASSALLRLLSDAIERRSAPNNRAMASVVRSLSQIRRYLPSIHLPLPVSALSSLLDASTDDTSISSLALQKAIVKLILWQAAYDNTLKRAVVSLLASMLKQPVCIHRAILTGLNDLAHCVDSDSVLNLLHSIPIVPIDSLLTGLRRVLGSATVEQSVRDGAVQLLISERVRRSVIDVRRYAACFSPLSPELIMSVLPLDDDISILTRFELVRSKALSFEALIACRTIIIGPRAIRPALVDAFAAVCAQAFPTDRRLTWILDLFDLMAAAGDPMPALRVLIVALTYWAHPLLPAGSRTLSGSLPVAIESYDDMSVDAIVRRLLRVLQPLKGAISKADPIRQVFVPCLISLASSIRRCAPVITSEFLSVI